MWCKGCIQGERLIESRNSQGMGKVGHDSETSCSGGKQRAQGILGGWAVVQENLNEAGKRHMSEFEEEVANRVKLRRRLSWGHIFREGDCYKDYGKGRV